MQDTLPLFAVPATTNRWRGPRPAGRPRPAAGLLIRYTDHDGVWYLLGLRCPALGGTWSNIGGSLDRGETPLAGAMREFTEELDLPYSTLHGARITAEVQSGTDQTPYTLFLIDTPTYFDNALLSWEHDDLAWWHANDVPDLPLHDGFARAWHTITEENL